MKVAHVINSLGKGGAEKLLSELLPILNEYVEITLVVLTNYDNIYGNLLEKKGIKVIFISSEKNVKKPIIFRRIKHFFSLNQFDIVNVHLFPSQYFVPFTTNSKLIFTEHSTTSKRRMKYFIPLEKYIYSKYDKYVFVSCGAKQSFESFLNVIDNKKNLVIYNGVNNNILVNKNENLKEVLQIPNEHKLVTMISSFKHEKDHKTLIKAIKDISNVQLILIGDGVLKNDVYNYVHLLNLERKVHFLGFKCNIEDYINQSDIVVQSSHREGFGLSVLESMALGKPILVSDIDGLKEVVDNPYYRFEQGNSEQLKSKIKSILFDSVQFEDAVNYSLVTSRKFSITNTAFNYLELYGELI